MQSLSGRLVALAMLGLGIAGQAYAQFTIPAGATFDVPAGGTFDAGCTPIQLEGSLNVNSGQLATNSNLNIAGTGVLNGLTGSIAVGGNLSSSGTFNAGTSTVTLTDGCVGNVTQLSGNLVFQNLVLSSSTGRSFVIPTGTQITVLGTLTLQGTPGQSIQLVSSGGGTAVINLGPATTVNRTFTTVAGNVQIGATPSAHAIPTLSTYGLWLLSIVIGSIALRFHRHQRACVKPVP